MTEVDLLPCPFCGGEAHIVEGDESAYVQCTQMKMHRAIWFSGDNDAANEVRQQWNRRALPSTAGEPVGVKPLGWVGNTAETSIGRYSLIRTPDGYAAVFGFDEEIAHVGFNAVDWAYGARRSAQDHAQADYEQRILSALSTLPPPPVAPQGRGEAERNAVVEAANELAELRALFDIQHKADMRAVKRWREANPGNELVLPDHAALLVWLMERWDETIDALKPFAAFAPEAEAFVERAAFTPGHSPIMPATKAFRLRDFERAAKLVASALKAPRS